MEMQQQVLKEHRVIKVLQVLKVLKVLLEMQQQVLKVLKVLLEMQQQVLKEHRVQEEHQVHRVLKDIRVVYQLMQFLQVVSLYGLVHQMLFQVVGYYVMVRTAHQI